MEAVRIFQKSVEKLKLCFTTYIGDGDTKAYPTVVKAEPYPNKQIVKVECVGHVQKGLVSAFENLKRCMVMSFWLIIKG